jgi:general secretion pathway protein D
MQRREPYQRRWARSGWAATMLTFAAGLLSGCITSNEQGAPHTSAPDVTGQIRSVDLSPRLPRRAGGVSPDTADGVRAATYLGDESSATAGAQPSGAATALPADNGPPTTGALTGGGQNSTGQGYEMNFETAPVATVAKAILGDILGVGYTIDPRVQATVSLSSGRPVPKKDILHVLESALRVSNVALVRDGQGYRLIPAAEAVGAAAIDSGAEPGYGISVVPLQYVSAQTLTKLLENFAAKPGMVRADTTRNLVVIQGNGADRRAAIETVLSFDADWMRGQSVGIYPVRNSTLEPIISELERIIDAGEGGLSQNVVKLQPIARQNAVLVVTRKPELLKTAATWISRLDKSGTAGTGVKVYRMRYGDARQVAALLNDIFTGGSSHGLDSPMNQLVPNGGVTTMASDRSTFGGSQQANGSQSNTGLQQTRAGAGSQQASTNTSTSFDARFADASGGRFAQSSQASPGGYSRSAPLGGGVGGMGGPGPLLPNVRIAPDVVNNALLIYANQENYRIIERTLHQLDQPQLQVAIDATIAEVTLNDGLQYGVQFFLKSKDVGLPKNSGSIVNNTEIATTTAALSRLLPGFNFLVGTEAHPRAILDALHAVTEVKVLSTPSVVVIDNQFATLQVGDQIPITTRQSTSVDVPLAPMVNNIDYRNTGVILRVAPRINANGNVLLDVEQEISRVANTPTADTLTPTVSQRRIRSSIAVASGQTVLLGGLMSERRDRNKRGIPGLDQVPGLGALFSHTEGHVERTELIIFIRPQIIRNGVDAHLIAEELRSKMYSKFGPLQPVRPRAVPQPPTK